MNTFTRDVLAEQARLLASDYWLGRALTSLAAIGNRAEIFSEMRNPEMDDAALGRVFRAAMTAELRIKALGTVTEATRVEIAAECAELRQADWSCAVPLTPCELRGDGS